MTLRHRFVSVFAVVAVLVLSGCKEQGKLIEKLNFSPSDNLENIRVSLVFSDRVKLDLFSAFELDPYGGLFINRYIEGTQRFEVGFDLYLSYLTDIASDNRYVGVEPTTQLPNGAPLGTPYALVEVDNKEPIAGQATIYGYVDVIRAAWFGMAVELNLLSDDIFPIGLSLTQVFLRDESGNPGVLASVFGPGQPGGKGGIAMMANVRQLADSLRGDDLEPRTLTLYAEPGVEATGLNAHRYQGDYQKMFQIQDRVIEKIERGQY